MKRHAVALSLILTVPMGHGVGPTEGPALRVPVKQLQAALHCPDQFVGGRDPVLLVHGLSQTGESAWSWNYGKVLPAQGYDVCLLDLPGYATGDIQVSTEYVVNAVRTMAGRSGRKVDLITFSQGALEARWALRWWPDIRRHVDDAVFLAGGPNNGMTPADALCAPRCVPALWQSRPGSRFIAALNSVDPTPDAASYTNVFSGTDELAFIAGGTPDPWTAAAAIEGARNIRVQDLCPGRPVEHVQETYDAAVNAFVLDALSHPGPADPTRVGAEVCTQIAMVGVEAGDVARHTAETALGLAVRAGQHQVDAEPMLASYAK